MNDETENHVQQQALDDRRGGEMTGRSYIEDVAELLAARLPGLDPGLLALYTLLVFTTGTATTLENVHDAWAVWTAARNPGHRSLIPFADLAVEVQELDRKYARAIRDVAAEVAK